MTDLPLEGLQIINTRPKHQAAEWSKQFRSAGASVIELPALEIQETSQRGLTSVLPLDQYSQLIFISTNAVKYFFEALPTPLEIPSETQITTIGKQTANRLADYSFNAYCPDIADSEHLLAMPHLQYIENQNILIIKGIGGRRLIAQTLKKRGAVVKQANVYRRYCPNPKINFDYLWQDRTEKIILITSGDAVDNLFKMMSDFQQQLQQATWLVLSKRIAATAQKKGVKHVIISDGEELLNTLVQYKKGLFHD